MISPTLLEICYRYIVIAIILSSVTIYCQRWQYIGNVYNIWVMTIYWYRCCQYISNDNILSSCFCYSLFIQHLVNSTAIFIQTYVSQIKKKQDNSLTWNKLPNWNMSFGSLSPEPSLGPARSLILNLEKQAIKKKILKKNKKSKLENNRI